MKRTLSLDLETYSDIDLAKCGVYAYVDSPSFEILLIAYCFDDDEVKIVDLALGDVMPQEVKEAILSDDVIKTAFNANFERTCLSKYFDINLKANSWCCTAVQASMLALPLSLESVGEVLGLNNKKMKEGKDLIKYFCCPCKSTKANGGRIRNLPIHDLDKWKIFKSYCIRDVEVESEIRNKLINYPISEKEMELYRLDQRINDRGILVDRDLVKRAVLMDNLHKEIITKRAYELTGLENPNSVTQLKDWFKGKGTQIESLSKVTTEELINVSEGETLEMLKLRLLMSKTSVKKYEAIERSVCSDKRVHGLLQFYGANRSGRWAGRLVQVQNLPQNHIKDLDLARSLVKNGTLEQIESLYGNVPKVLSELIRTAFIPKKGSRFIVADFSAIEARVLAYLAGEKWRLDVFKTHGKIYEASASAMFHVSIEQITKGSELRQKGKISELALGYGGSVGALISMRALDMGLKETELKELVTAWRSANPNITKFWWNIDKAAITAIKDKTEAKVGKIEFKYRSGILFIKLPSGRSLSYIKPRIQTNKFEREGLTYEGIGESKKWVRIETYGPKLVENIVQAVARDLLAEGMLRLDKAGYEIVMHIHDEVVIEAPYNKGSLKDVCEIMGITPCWIKGLFLRADGYECNYYKKD